MTRSSSVFICSPYNSLFTSYIPFLRPRKIDLDFLWFGANFCANLNPGCLKFLGLEIGLPLDAAD